MRIHIDLDEALVSQVDEISGRRGRSRFIREATVNALNQKRRADLILSAAGAAGRATHDWDEDTAGWVRAQRRADAKRVG